MSTTAIFSSLEDPNILRTTPASGARPLVTMKLSFCTLYPWNELNLGTTPLSQTQSPFKLYYHPISLTLYQWSHCPCVLCLGPPPPCTPLLPLLFLFPRSPALSYHETIGTHLYIDQIHSCHRAITRNGYCRRLHSPFHCTGGLRKPDWHRCLLLLQQWVVIHRCEPFPNHCCVPSRSLFGYDRSRGHSNPPKL